MEETNSFGAPSRLALHSQCWYCSAFFCCLGVGSLLEMNWSLQLYGRALSNTQRE